eukprot:CAMPEP_0206531524 /NCGR_PEP_ID=MMETSP0325_2-20121206/3814_1 /ASSEMBLY_ACC=CAM_ASM_000347 /TAXON_ID=2866 /ORGANISM="Crypthecodinium cohnii, Strain Seligo" /LENGTH=136 /DNA_ID=CAMNT_0054027779 /DNA_START=582 /DNA_END=992 /DNA_ORIENTATION=-
MGLGEDPLWTLDPPLEDILMAGDDESQDGLGSPLHNFPPRERPHVPAAALERFGDMIDLLGPRFKTTKRQAIWDQAYLEGTTTRLQRRMMRSLKPAGTDLPPKRRAAPEDLPDMDNEKAARNAWLAIRRSQNNSAA